MGNSATLLSDLILTNLSKLDCSRKVEQLNESYKGFLSYCLSKNERKS